MEKDLGNPELVRRGETHQHQRHSLSSVRISVRKIWKVVCWEEERILTASTGQLLEAMDIGHKLWGRASGRDDCSNSLERNDE